MSETVSRANGEPVTSDGSPPCGCPEAFATDASRVRNAAAVVFRTDAWEYSAACYDDGSYRIAAYTEEGWTHGGIHRLALYIGPDGDLRHVRGVFDPTLPMCHVAPAVGGEA